jgi:hypothetical protein
MLKYPFDVSDLLLERQVEVLAFLAVGVGLVALGLYLRLRVFIGTRPGGVDTWYYLASADAIRRQKRLPISLPQYLLHDKHESYPAVFPLFLALLPQHWLKRNFWLVSPLIDSAQLLLLYLLTFRLTNSILAAGTAGLIYAVTPQLISETRNLNGRAFASLLQTLALVTLLRSAIPSDGPTANLLPGEWTLWSIAVILIALLYNTHTSTTIALLVSVATLTVVFGDWRYLAAGLLGLPMAVLISGGYYLKVIANHLHAARFWIRNVHLTRAHQVNDSPVLGQHNSTGDNRRNGTTRATRGLYQFWPSLIVRILGENPFILAMLVTPIPRNVWAEHMYWWAVAILVWAVVTTFGGPLRILGPGFQYMKASVFPTGYALAVTVNIQEGAFSFVGLAVLLAFIASFGALAYFYRVMNRRTTEHTAQTPPDLAEAATYLRGLPGLNVLVLPSMYADFVAYSAQKSVLWGGHSGDLRKFEEFFPVVRKPIDHFVERYHIDYLLVDLAYTTPDLLGLDASTNTLASFGSIVVYEASRVIPPSVEVERHAAGA